MPSKRGTATKSKFTGRERKFEADRHRAEEKRRKREAERALACQEAANGAQVGEGDRGR